MWEINRSLNKESRYDKESTPVIRGLGKKRKTKGRTIKEDLALSSFPLDMIYHRKLLHCIADTT